jgi:heme exporter protein C
MWREEVTLRGRPVPVRNLLLGATALSMVATLYLVFVWVPTDFKQGVVQRIFDFHVPMAWVAFLAFFVVFLGSVLFLWKGSRRWDRLAHSSAQIGVVFAGLVLVSGSLWAKPIWGTWWSWDARLTSALVLFLIYLAYLMVRAYASQVEQANRFAAVVGIVGFADVPLVYLSIYVWRTLHPAPVVGPEGGGLPGSMLATLMVSLVAFTLLYVTLLWLLVRLRTLSDTVRRMQVWLEMGGA